MSQYDSALYMRNLRKRLWGQGAEDIPKRPKTAAERVRCFRAKNKTAVSNASSTIAWDAGEGSSTRGRKS